MFPVYFALEPISLASIKWHLTQRAQSIGSTLCALCVSATSVLNLSSPTQLLHSESFGWLRWLEHPSIVLTQAGSGDLLRGLSW